MTFAFTPNTSGTPAGKLADAEIRFDDSDGLLAGLRLIGFSVWERRGGTGRNLTFPARQYTVNSERRSFALLRPQEGVEDSTQRFRDALLEAYTRFEEGQ